MMLVTGEVYIVRCLSQARCILYDACHRRGVYCTKDISVDCLCQLFTYIKLNADRPYHMF